MNRELYDLFVVNTSVIARLLRMCVKGICGAVFFYSCSFNPVSLGPPLGVTLPGRST
jgi:hypothetical protein